MAGVALVVTAGLGAERAGARRGPKGPHRPGAKTHVRFTLGGAGVTPIREEGAMTGRRPPRDALTPRKSCLRTLAREAGREADSGALSEADASELIDQLQVVSGRGRDT